MSSPTNSTLTDSSPPRKNRWKGPASTWHQITEEERGLAASLDELRNRDLSVHLYNAFALKKRAKNLNAKDVRNDESEDRDESNGFVPSKKWTAWPIEAREVPREGEQIGPDDEDEKFTLRKKEVVKLSRDLEDVLMGVTLKYARDRFLARETAEDHGGHAADDDVEEMSIDEPRQEPSGDVQVREESVRELSEPSQYASILRPVVSADDERSQDLLRPSIRHTLSKLDDVLMALHYARKTCRQYASQAEFDTDVESRSRAPSIGGDETNKDSPVKKAVGRPRKFQSIDSPMQESTPNENGLDDPDLWRAKTTRRGRPMKVYERLEGETQHEYLTRVARIQKKPLPVFAPSIEPRRPTTPKRGTTPGSVSSQKSPRKVSENTRKHMLRLRDWSEVLGSAALVGFSPNVITRATQRCANLFGENVIMRTMVEGPAAGGKNDLVKEYHPGMIPDFDEPGESGPYLDEFEDESSSSASDTKTLKNEESTTIKHRVYYCPVVKCQRNKEGFRTAAKLSNHAQTEHNFSKRNLDALRVDSDEEMYGAVHTDRFLKPITGKRGWRGSDREKRKRRKAGMGNPSGEQVSASSGDDVNEDEDEVLDSYSESESEEQDVDENEDEDEGVDERIDSGDRDGGIISS
ncbi:02da787c-66bd-48fd-b3b5-875190e1c005 [Sclerotinia trifoliorum]|uniref:02da787c-66bd-48fd-b3b5-875190e1c005 n=1 Tax=Sclerotinia trifoliorum TaxID=28548 RepID=A0A8H2ZQT5_9HELO|nr:02da787c-66bd-48fd-b3b5-875190e1c005 [Sclerotinia trifoliorum]